MNDDTYPCLAIVGSGSLAGAVARVLSVSDAEFDIRIIGRNRSALESIVRSCQARSFALTRRSRFAGILLANMDSALTEYILGSSFEAILIGASLQSPWEIGAGTTAWGRLVRSAGFGVTLPLQFSIAARVARAASKMNPVPFVVNAAYPDAVNAALHASQLPIDAGIGNVAILHALGNDASARIVAHHRHLAELTEFGKANLLFRAQSSYLDGIVAGLRALSGSALNEVTAACAVRLITDLVCERECYHHVPGPRGMIGGYPALVRNGTITPHFAPFGESEAIETNVRAALDEGVTVQQISVVFSERAGSVMSEVTRLFQQPVPVADLDDLASAMMEIRGRLS